MRDLSEMNGNVAEEEALLREDMGGGGGGGRYSGGMKPPMVDEKSNGYVDRRGDLSTLFSCVMGPSPHSRAR